MSNGKKFGTSLFGFTKSDVNAFIERVIREFDLRLKEKDEENAKLKAQMNDLQAKYDQLSQSADYLIKEKEKIAGVLMQAQEKAEAMMAEAQEKAEAMMAESQDKALTEKARLDQTLESEREKIVDIKRDLKSLKSYVVDLLTKYEVEIDNSIVKIEEQDESYQASEKQNNVGQTSEALNDYDNKEKNIECQSSDYTDNDNDIEIEYQSNGYQDDINHSIEYQSVDFQSNESQSTDYNDNNYQTIELNEEDVENPA